MLFTTLVKKKTKKKNLVVRLITVVISKVTLVTRASRYHRERTSSPRDGEIWSEPAAPPVLCLTTANRIYKVRYQRSGVRSISASGSGGAYRFSERRVSSASHQNLSTVRLRGVGCLSLSVSHSVCVLPLVTAGPRGVAWVMPRRLLMKDNVELMICQNEVFAHWRRDHPGL